MPKIEGARLIADLKRLADFGRYKTGVHRPTYSPEDVASRQWLAGQFAAAGLDPVIDGIGNVIGRDRRAGRRLLVGSHSETQPHGGWLDGALGVIYGLELARAFAADPALAGLGIEAVAWADEEGHYGNMLGSRSFTEGLDAAEFEAAESRDGKKLRLALAEAGLAGRVCEHLDPSRYVGYLEAHIEQGDTLESRGLRIGVVEAIIGSWNYWVTLTGQQNHAGTTQMSRRRDAGVAMVRLAGRINDQFAEIAGQRNASRAVWTIGRMLLDPNAPSIVPGRAEMQVQFRDTDTGILARFEETLFELVGEADGAGPCRVAIAPLSKSQPAAMDAAFQAAIEAAAERHAPGLHLRMPSGAGHDAQILSRRLRSAMLFVPSIDGISHHWAEDTKEDDIVLGAQVFADAAAAILQAGVSAMALVLQESQRALFYAPYYAALALGAYQQEGLEVRLVSAARPAAAPNALFHGTADVVWGGPMRVNQIYDQRAHCDLVCIGEAVTRDPFMLIGRSPRPNFRLAVLTALRIGVVSEVPTPWLCLQDDLRRIGLDPEALSRFGDRGMADNAAALRYGELDVVQLLQPLAEELIASGMGHLWYAAADRGLCSYTTFYTRAAILDAKREEMLKLVRGLYRTQRWMRLNPPDRLAEVIQPYFPAVPRSLLTAAVARYRAQGIWGRNPILPREGYERLVTALTSSGFARGIPYESVVDNSLAEQVVDEDPPPLT